MIILEVVESAAHGNSKRLKERAISHYSKISGRPIPECEILYEAIKSVISPAVRVSIGMPVHEIGVFLDTGRLEIPKTQATKQSMNAIGVETGVVASVVIKDNYYQGLTSDGCSIEFSGQMGGLVICGGLDRLRNPVRVDYEPDAKAACLPIRLMIDAKVASIMMAMDSSDASGIEIALQNVVDEAVEYGTCDAILVSNPERTNISAIRVYTPEQRDGIRSMLDSIDKIVPIYLMDRVNEFKVIDPFISPADESNKLVSSVIQSYFANGDRVSMKRTMSNAQVVGTILDVSNGSVTVEWDGGDRTIYDMAEALMRIASAPTHDDGKPSGIVYATPGMSDSSIEILSSLGIDPISVYSIASHCRPITSGSLGWREKMISAMSALGLDGEFVSGYAEGNEVFEPKEWFETKLPHGVRLVIDASHDGIRIMAGSLDEYVVPSNLMPTQE